MEFEVVKRGFGEKRKYYFKGSDGKIYGEGYDSCYLHREKMGRKRLTVVEGFALVRKGDWISGSWYLVDVDNGFELYDIAPRMQSLCETGDVDPIFDWVATKPFLQHSENCRYMNIKELKETGFSHDYKYDEYREGFNVVYENGKYYFIDEDFKLHGEGYVSAYNFHEGFAVVLTGGKFYYVDKDFKLHGEGYGDAYDFKEGFAVVKKGKQKYTINKNFERIKRNNQIMEDVDYLQEAKDDLKSIVGIPAIRFSDDFVNKLKAIVLNYYEKEVEEAKSNKVEALRSEMEYIKKIIDEKKEQYSEKVADPNYQSLLKQAQSLFEKPEEKSEEKPEETLDEEQK